MTHRCVYPSPKGREGLFEVEHGHTFIIYPLPGRSIECRPSPHSCVNDDLACTDEGLIVLSTTVSNKLRFQIYNPARNAWDWLGTTQFTDVKGSMLCDVGSNMLACLVQTGHGSYIFFVYHRVSDGVPLSNDLLTIFHRKGEPRETLHMYEGRAIWVTHKGKLKKGIPFFVGGCVHTAATPNGSALLGWNCHGVVQGYDFGTGKTFTIGEQDFMYFHRNVAIYAGLDPDPAQEEPILIITKRANWHDVLDTPKTPASKEVALTTAWCLEYLEVPRELIDIVQVHCRYAIC